MHASSDLKTKVCFKFIQTGLTNDLQIDFIKKIIPEQAGDYLVILNQG